MTDTQLKTLKDALSKDNGKGTRAFALDLTAMCGYAKKERKNG